MTSNSTHAVIMRIEMTDLALSISLSLSVSISHRDAADVECAFKCLLADFVSVFIASLHCHCQLHSFSFAFTNVN